MKTISVKQAAQRLTAADNVLILAHRRPDGDTIGSAYGLYYALKQLGKSARVECSDPFPQKFTYFYDDTPFPDFEPDYIVAVDTATKRLLGINGLYEKYGDRVDLAIDHHKSNEFYATDTLLDVDAPATTELMYHVLCEMGVDITVPMADALFTGLITDTGGLRFASVTAATYRVAAYLVEAGANHADINRRLFETISRGRMEVEALAINSLEYYHDGRIALLCLPEDVKEVYHIAEEELDGISSLPRTIEGVDMGITLRHLNSTIFRVSLRSHPPYDSSSVCDIFGGGGHASAAGCTLEGELADVKKKLIDVAIKELDSK